MRSQSVPANAHVGPQLQRGAVATLVCVPTAAPLIQSRLDSPPPNQSSCQTHVSRDAPGHTLSFVLVKFNPDDSVHPRVAAALVWLGCTGYVAYLP